LRPTAITLDVMMPDLDGWSVLAALRQDSELAEIPVIMVTILDEQRRSVALGAAGYLTKPIDRERLRRLIGRFRSPARPTRVLLVEDDEAQRERVSTWLDGGQWSVQGRQRARGLARLPTTDGRDRARSDDARDGRLCGRRGPRDALAGYTGHRHHRARSRHAGSRAPEFGVQSVLVKDMFGRPSW
jgi:CheY-like chemotaxis protein